MWHCIAYRRSKVVELNDGRIPIFSKGMKLVLLNIRGLANDIKGDINIANTFNNYFVDLNKPSDNADDLTYVERTNFTESNCNEEFVFSPVDDDTILRELSRLDESKSVGIDSISAKPLIWQRNIIYYYIN